MSRGWESKDVESQQELAAAERREKKAALPSADQIETARRREGLEMTRARAEADLLRATHPRHRTQLEAGIAHLDAELAKLN